MNTFHTLVNMASRRTTLSPPSPPAWLMEGASRAIRHISRMRGARLSMAGDTCLHLR